MMMETSAVLAVLLNEPERTVILDAIEAAAKPFTTAVVVAEAAMAFAKRTGIAPSAALEAIQTFLDEAAISTVAFVPAMIERAIEGREKFGKGRHPRAQLRRLPLLRRRPLLSLDAAFQRRRLRANRRE
jgi:ribonuclease VapC